MRHPANQVFELTPALTVRLSQGCTAVALGLALVCAACTSQAVPPSADGVTPPVPATAQTAVPTVTATSAYPAARDIQRRSRRAMSSDGSFRFHLEAQLETELTDVPLSFEGDFQAPDRTDGTVETTSGTATRVITVGETRYLETLQEPLTGTVPFVLSPAQIVEVALSGTTDLTLEGETTLDGESVYHLSGSPDWRAFGGGTGEFEVAIWVGMADHRLRRVTVAGALDLGDEGDPVIVAVAGRSVPVYLTLALSDFGKEVAIEPPIAENIPSLVVPRAAHTATLLQDGRVLVVGGMHLVNAEIYDPSTGISSLTGSMAEVHMGHTATLLDDCSVLVTGAEWGGAGHLPKSAEVYDPSAGVWSSVGRFRQRSFHTSVLLADGAVLVMGGWLEQWNATRVAEIYEPSTGEWLKAGRMGQLRAEHAAVVLQDGAVLVAGGVGGAGEKLALASAELLDPQTDTWSQTGSMAQGRSLPTATLLADGRVLVLGGRDGKGNALSSAEMYDPSTHAWSIAADMADSRMFHTATFLNDGRVLVTGGSAQRAVMMEYIEVFDPRVGIREGGNILASVEIFDPATGSWSPAADMSEARKAHTATLLPDGRVLVAGGTTGAGVSASSVELYDPAADTWSAMQAR